jgi:hypothetical protein
MTLLLLPLLNDDIIFYTLGKLRTQNFILQSLASKHLLWSKTVIIAYHSLRSARYTKGTRRTLGYYPRLVSCLMKDPIGFSIGHGIPRLEDAS